MARTYKLFINKTKQGSWPTIQNTALRPKISFKDNLFFHIQFAFNLHMSDLGPKKKNTIEKLSEIQEKAIRIIGFKDKNYPTNELYYNYNSTILH